MAAEGFIPKASPGPVPQLEAPDRKMTSSGARELTASDPCIDVSDDEVIRRHWRAAHVRGREGPMSFMSSSTRRRRTASWISPASELIVQ